MEATSALRRQPVGAAPPNPQGGRGAVGHLRCCTGPAHQRLGAHLSLPRPPGSCPRHQLSGRCGSHAPARRVRQRPARDTWQQCPKRAQRGAGTRGRRPLGRRTGELSSASAQAAAPGPSKMGFHLQVWEERRTRGCEELGCAPGSRAGTAGGRGHLAQERGSKRGTRPRRHAAPLPRVPGGTGIVSKSISC